MAQHAGPPLTRPAAFIVAALRSIAIRVPFRVRLVPYYRGWIATVVRRLVGDGQVVASVGPPATPVRMEISPVTNLSYLLDVYERPVFDYLDAVLHRGDVMIDVGAHLGYHALVAASLVGSDGRVVACEPVDALADAVAANAERNGFDHLEVRRSAVTAESGTAPMVVGWGLSARSMLAGPSSADPDEEGYHLETVATTTIDTIRAELGRPVTLVKIDVEGAELGVIDGALTTIATDNPHLLIELNEWTRPENLAIVNRCVALGLRVRVLGGRGLDVFVVARRDDPPPR